MTRDRSHLRLVTDENAAKLALYPERYRNVHALPITRPQPQPPTPPRAA